MNDYGTIQVEKQDGIALITLNLPDKLNALSMPMRAELAAASSDAASDPAVRVVVLTGAGRAFCSGADVTSQGHFPDSLAARERVQRLHNWLMGLQNMEKPLITAVNGVAAGGGASVALLGDIILAADTARFIFAFRRVALVPDLAAMYTLPRLIGALAAKELFLTGRPVDAEEALRLGMVNRVVPAAQLMETTMEMAATIAAGPTRALGLTKRIVNRSLDASLPELLEMEAAAQALCMMSDDHGEGVRAFLEKRPPRFSQGSA